jgi:predicted aspartyl protease
MKMNRYLRHGLRTIIPETLSFIVIIFCASAVQAQNFDWQRKEINWRLGDSKIKAINYPAAKLPRISSDTKKNLPTISHRQLLPANSSRLTILAQENTASVGAYVIESPPIDGFTPWITITATDERSGDAELDAVPTDDVTGNFLTPAPDANYAIGILDTGASIHVMNNNAAVQTGLYAADLITTNTIEIAGVTGSVNALVSQPFGLYIDGLGIIDPCSGLLTGFSSMVGEYNVSIAVGPANATELQTAVGTPLSVYYTTFINNKKQPTVSKNNNQYTGPDIHIYPQDDPCIPEYSNIIPLELRPLGAVSVQYTPEIDPYEFVFIPQSPSTIIGNLSQSVFFVHSVDIYHGINSAIDKNRFMLDTGAQVSVIGSRIASRLRLNPDYPEFTVEITGLTGESITAPGFIIDSIQIPAFGDWFIAENVPVILLDISSPEGGTLDGIIGMNLFTKFNLVLRGGGIYLQDDPSLELEPLNHIAADIAPEGGDGVVDSLDLQAFALAWLSEGTIPPSSNWNPKADLAPEPHDNIVNFLDFAVFAEHWLEHAEP